MGQPKRIPTLRGPGGLPQDYFRLPAPGRLPAPDADDRELDKLDKRFELTNQRERSTTRPIPMNEKAHAMQSTRRLIKRLKSQLETGQLSEDDAYNAIINLGHAQETLRQLESKTALMVAARFESKV